MTVNPLFTPQHGHIFTCRIPIQRLRRHPNIILRSAAGSDGIFHRNMTIRRELNNDPLQTERISSTRHDDRSEVMFTYRTRQALSGSVAALKRLVRTSLLMLTVFHNPPGCQYRGVTINGSWIRDIITLEKPFVRQASHLSSPPEDRSPVAILASFPVWHNLGNTDGDLYGGYRNQTPICGAFHHHRPGLFDYRPAASSGTRSCDAVR